MFQAVVLSYESRSVLLRNQACLKGGGTKIPKNGHCGTSQLFDFFLLLLILMVQAVKPPTNPDLCY